MVIIQQTLLIGIGMVGGYLARAGYLYRTLIPAGERRHGRAADGYRGNRSAYLSVYCLTLLVPALGVPLPDSSATR